MICWVWKMFYFLFFIHSIHSFKLKSSGPEQSNYVFGVVKNYQKSCLGKQILGTNFGVRISSISSNQELTVLPGIQIFRAKHSLQVNPLEVNQFTELNLESFCDCMIYRPTVISRSCRIIEPHNSIARVHQFRPLDRIKTKAESASFKNVLMRKTTGKWRRLMKSRWFVINYMTFLVVSARHRMMYGGVHRWCTLSPVHTVCIIVRFTILRYKFYHRTAYRLCTTELCGT